MKEQLRDCFMSGGISLTPLQEDQFLAYHRILLEWNKVMNLTAITDDEEILYKHFLDSALLCTLYGPLSHQKLIDVGTGAGFPGIVLKILYPSLKATLLDSLNKRISFLKEVKSECHLENLELIHGRAEDIGHDDQYREQYDICVSRAVSNLNTLSEYCLPFVKTGGRFVAYKSLNAKEEYEHAQNAIHSLGGSLEQIKEYSLPKLEMARAFIVIRKSRHTPQKYPRKAGTPSKMPLV